MTKNVKVKSSKKWKLVEQIVAAAFEEPSLQVQRNVRLPSLRRQGGKGGTREIDVLIRGRLVGQKIYLPIECKYHNRRIDSIGIGAFIDKLHDVGLSTHTSIFVSTAGFTQPAVERAQEVGMRTLVLSGTDISETKESIFEAIQSYIFMVGSLTKMCFDTEDLVEDGSSQHIMFYDRYGYYKGSLIDLLWEAWLMGTPPLVCGHHIYCVEIPNDWRYLVDGRKNSISNIRVEYDVSALTFQLKGEAKSYHFVDALTRTTERQTFRVQFPTSPIDEMPKIFETESTLNEFLSAPARARITIGRIRLPKLVMNQGMLWPMQSTFIEQLMRLPPEDVQREFLQFSKSSSNNFWEFDQLYAQALRKIRYGINISMKVEPI